MSNLSERNPSYGIESDDYKQLYEYLAVQKITYLYDDELFERLTRVDTSRTGKSEELLDAYLILDQGDEIQLMLFQFKFKERYDGGISTKDLYAFVDRMNRVFLRGDLQDTETLEAYREVRDALNEAQKSNKRAHIRIQCYYIVNGQNISHTDASKVQEIRDTFSHDRQTFGFTFETYGGIDIYNLCAYGRIKIQEEMLELSYDRGERSTLVHDIGPNPNGMPEKVVVGFVNVNQLIRLVDRYSNNELFEKNVRLFLGTNKDVNRSIIETVTGDQSAWFGFMNNGVSITADTVELDLPSRNRKIRVAVKGMQIINGCQTVNALYHAKYAADLRDRFQGNSNVMVRIYQIAPENKAFLDALIIATNSQNAIRPEDLLSNDPIQKSLQQIYSEYGIGYERKEGEALSAIYYTKFSKEQAAMAYIAVFQGDCSKLRNSLSRREFFRKGDDYYNVFNLRGDDGEESNSTLPEDFTPGADARRRALQIFVARCLEEGCRRGIACIEDKRNRGSLRKGAYYLAHIIYLKQKAMIDELINEASVKPPRAKVSRGLSLTADEIVGQSFNDACIIFQEVLANYLREVGGNEDAALKNSAFARKVEAEANGSWNSSKK